MVPRRAEPASSGNRNRASMAARKNKHDATPGVSKKSASQKAMDDGKKLPQTPGRRTSSKSGLHTPPRRQSPSRSASSSKRRPSPRRNYQRPESHNDDDNNNKNNPSEASSPIRRSLTPWMTGGHMMRAPSKPQLTVPKNWTTRSGRFRPSESGWGFADAKSTFGMITAAGRSVVSGGLSGFGASHHRQVRIGRKKEEEKEDEEIQDPELLAQFHADLEKMGIKPVILVDTEWDTRSAVSVVSMSDTSYILDLAQQKQFRHKVRQEEALEDAFILYKAALAEGAVDDEEMFFMLLQETKKELDEKYAEKDQKIDEMLDEALEAEMERREKEKQRKKGLSDDEETEPENQLTHIIAEEEHYAEVVAKSAVDVGDEKSKGDSEDKSKQRSSPKTQAKTTLTYTTQDYTSTNSNELEKPTRKSGGFFSCCGKDVEDSVVNGTKPTMGELVSQSLKQRDPAYFQKLRKQQQEEEKRRQQVELTEADKWWQDNPVQVNVPEVEDDVRSRSVTRKSNESSMNDSEYGSRPTSKRMSWQGESSEGERSPRRSSRSTIGSSVLSSGTSEANISNHSRSGVDGKKSPKKIHLHRGESDSGISRTDKSSVKRTKSVDASRPSSMRSPSPGRKKRSSSLTPNGGRKRTKSHRKTKSSIEPHVAEKVNGSTQPGKKGNKKKKKGDVSPGPEASPKKAGRKKSKAMISESESGATVKQRSRSSSRQRASSRSKVFDDAKVIEVAARRDKKLKSKDKSKKKKPSNYD